MAQSWAISFYNSKRWRKCRAYILIRDKYMCRCNEILGGEPCGEPASEVHHVIKLTPKNIDDPRISLGEDNLLSVDETHHREWIHNDSRDCAPGFCFDDVGNIIPIGR